MKEGKYTIPIEFHDRKIAEEVKKVEEKIMTNLEHLKLAKKEDKDYVELSKKENEFHKKHGYGIYDYPSKDKEKKLELMPAEYRKIKALEIIAEELIILNSK